MLWGAYAGSKADLIDASKHLILKAPHPSPLSSYRGFFGCKHFSKANEYLKETKQTEIIMVNTFRDMGSRGDRYYIVKTKPFNDKIKAVYPNELKLIYIGENSVYESTQPEHWDHIEKVTIIRDKQP